ncbi:hypothetical protein [Bradyrhizobium sp. USDA 4473]
MPAGSWSAKEEQKLLQLNRETSLTQREIAQKIGRTEAAVVARLSGLRKRVAEEKRSACDDRTRKMQKLIHACDFWNRDVIRCSDDWAGFFIEINFTGSQRDA